MTQRIHSILLHYIHPDNQIYAGSEMVVRQNIEEVIQLNQATLVHLNPWKLWPENTWPIFNQKSHQWHFVGQTPHMPLVWRETCFYSGRDSIMCPTFIDLGNKSDKSEVLNDSEHFAQLVYPKGDRTVKVNSLARLDLKERIHEINDNVGAAWEQWKQCHKDPTNGSSTYKYHSRIDAILMQMRRVLDDIFVSYFYKQFKKETLDIGFYEVDSLQWLCQQKPFKGWPSLNSPTFDSDDRDDLKRKRKVLRRIFIEENHKFLDILTRASNSSKHSYFNTTPRSKIGNEFPTLLMNLEVKNEKGRLEEININLSQMILGFIDLLNDIVSRIALLNTTGNIPEPYPSHCKCHDIQSYELEYPRPA